VVITELTKNKIWSSFYWMNDKIILEVNIMKSFFTPIFKILTALSLVFIAACGGGGGDSTTPPPTGGGGGGGGGGSSPTLPALITASYMLDVDEDGDLDIILGTQGDPVRTADILLINDGTGQFSIKENAFPDHHLGTGGSTINITSADFNNDGNVDIVASTNDAREGTFDDTIQLHLYFGNGDGTFTDGTANITDGLLTEYPEWIRVGDFDGDGAIDFLITSNGCQGVDDCHGGRIFLNDGSGNFAIASITSTDAERSYTDTRLIWENDGNLFPENGSTRFALDVFVDDMNGDGKLDLIAPGGYAAGPILVSFINTSTPGNLSFDIVYNLYDSSDPFVGPSVKNGVLMDINNDGLKDVITSSSISGQGGVTTPVYAFISQGDGVFAEDSSIFSPSQPGVEHARQWLTDDFNQDGFDDLLVTDHGFDFSPFPGHSNLLLINDGAGTLEDVTANNLSVLSAFTHGASTGDLNGDGFPDLFLNNADIDQNSSFSAEKEARLWINDGDGSFTSRDLGL